METSKRGLLSEHLAVLPDARVDRTPRHLWWDIVVMAVCAVMGGADPWVDLEADGRATYEWLKRLLPLPQGIPFHDTWARVGARVAPEAFRPCFLAWLTAGQERLGEPLASHVVASDGTAARPSFDRAIDRGPLHLVRAWATAAHGVLGPRAVEQKRDEHTAIPPWRQRLELSGGLVTIDALGPQQEMAQTRIEREADSVCALQGTQGTWQEDVALFWAWADTPPYRALGPPTAETHPAGHGREERRRPPVTNEIAWLRGSEAWVGWHTMAMGEAWRTQGAAVSSARRSSSRSLGVDAQQRAESVRGHGAIEHARHWGLASAFREDDSRIRQGHAPDHCARLRPIALNRLKHEKTSRHGGQVKSNHAGWDHDS